MSEVVTVGVVVVRRALRSVWQSHAWLPYAVLPEPPDTPVWTRIGADQGDELWYAGTYGLELHRVETANYRDNLNSETPKLWVVLRVDVPEPPFEVMLVTADPSEGEGATEGGTEIVEPVPMPAAIVERLIGFYEDNHVERAFIKRKRDRADPEALARRVRVDDED